MLFNAVSLASIQLFKSVGWLTINGAIPKPVELPIPKFLQISGSSFTALVGFKRLFPKKFWNKLHLQIIYYGREYCQARNCYGLTCKICTSCYPARKKLIKTKKA